MIGRILLTTAGAIALAAPTAIEARVVEYLTDPAAIDAAALDQGIEGPFATSPPRGTANIALETPSAADHRVAVVSIYCQAYKIENPVSVLIQDLVLGADNDGKLADAGNGEADITIRMMKASTLLRCLTSNDLNVLCKNNVKMTAQATFRNADGTVTQLPLFASVERKGRVGGFCGNIARYTGIVTREAGVALINQALAAYEAAQSSDTSGKAAGP